MRQLQFPQNTAVLLLTITKRKKYNAGSQIFLLSFL